MRTITPIEVKTLIKALGVSEIQAKAFIDLMFHCGTRPAETCALKWSDVNGDRVHVRNGKGGRSRVVDLAATYGYFDAWRQAAAGKGEFIFATRSGKPWHTNQVRRLFARLRRLTGIDVRPHGLRHAHALAVWDRTKDLGLVSRQLGHQRLATTDEYLKGRGTGLGQVAALSF